MSQSKYPFYFLLLSLAIALVVIYFVLQPFLTPLILAAVFAFLFQPVYKKSLRILGGHPSLAAFATTIVILILVIAPLAFLGTQIFKESTHLYNVVSGKDGDGVAALFQNVSDKIYDLAPVLKNFNVDLNHYFEKGMDVIVGNFGMIFSNAAKIILDIFVFLIAFYFLLKDGEKLKEYLVKINPLQHSDNELIVARLEIAVSSVIKGSLFVGLIQGVLAGIGFAVFGVPNALLWGAVTVIAALVPGLGTALVIVPAVIFLFLMGNMFGAIGLLVWGIIVGLIDNFIRPKLIGDSIQLHPLGVFLMVIGGIAFFGPAGFLLGPLVMVLFIAFIDIYFLLKAREKTV